MSVEIRKIANKTLRFAAAASLSAGLAGGQDARAGNPQEEVIRAIQKDTHTLVVENPNTINTIGTLLNTVEDTASQEQQPEPEPTPSITLTPVGPSNIRSGPSTQSEIVGSADVNRQISALGYFDAPDRYRWYYFRTDKGGGWIREDRVRDPNEDVETIPNLEGVLNIPVLNPDGSPSNKKLLETNVNLALVNLAFKNIREAGFPEGTTNPSNIALLGQKEDSLVFIQTNPIERPGGGINEAGSIFTIDIDEGELITRIGFFGLGQIKDIGASYEIDLGEDMFSVEEMSDGFVRIGDNMIFYWRGAVEKLIEGLSQEEAISQNLIQITGGELSGRSFTIEENRLILSDGSTAEIDFENGIGKVQIPEVQTRQETEEDYFDIFDVMQPEQPLQPIQIYSIRDTDITTENFSDIFTEDKMTIFADAMLSQWLERTYNPENLQTVIKEFSIIPDPEELDLNQEIFIGVWDTSKLMHRNIEYNTPAVLGYIAGLQETTIDDTYYGGRPDEKIYIMSVWVPLSPNGESATLLFGLRKFKLLDGRTVSMGPAFITNREGRGSDIIDKFIHRNYYEESLGFLSPMDPNSFGQVIEMIEDNVNSQVLFVQHDWSRDFRNELHREVYEVLRDCLSDGKIDNDYPNAHKVGYYIIDPTNNRLVINN